MYKIAADIRGDRRIVRDARRRPLIFDDWMDAANAADLLARHHCIVNPYIVKHKDRYQPVVLAGNPIDHGEASPVAGE